MTLLKGMYVCSHTLVLLGSFFVVEYSSVVCVI